MAENLLAQLLSPTLARRAEQERLQGQILATADARNPLLAEAGRTANLMRGSLGGLFGTDLRSATERITAQAQEIQNNPNLTEEQKIRAMKQLDPGLGMAYEQQVLSTRKSRKELEDPGYTVKDIIVGNIKDPITGMSRSIKRTAVLDAQGNVIRYLGPAEESEAEVVSGEETSENQTAESSNREAVIQDLASRLDAAKKDGGAVRLPDGRVVRWNPEAKSFEYVQVETPNIGGDLGVSP